MKRLFALMAGLTLAASAHAQSTEYTEGYPIERQRQRQLYIEMGGKSASLLSMHCDARLQDRLDGLGWSIGLAFDTYDEYSCKIGVPMGVNYLLGKRNHFLELGAGATAMLYIIQRGERHHDTTSRHRGTDRSKSGFYLLPTTTIGYRYEPAYRGFSFAIGVSPTYLPKYSTPSIPLIPIPYIRFGISL